MKKLSLTIGHLYGDMMNTYGDDGNIITLKKRCEWRGIEVEVKVISIMYDIQPKEFDLYFFGGGQDQAQKLLSDDLVKNHKGYQLEKDLQKGVPALAICGGYQLLGDYYKPQNAPEIPGLGFLPVTTDASNQRMIGNLLIESPKFGKLIGFENHSGKTYLKNNATTLGQVIKGFGNNGEDQTEGCVYKNTIGCYMHGSLLPKNPQLADWLIKTALKIKYGEKIELEPLNDSLENQSHHQVIQKLSS